MHLKAVSDVIFLLKEEKKKVGFWSLVVDVPLLIFSSFYFIFIAIQRFQNWCLEDN